MLHGEFRLKMHKAFVIILISAMALVGVAFSHQISVMPWNGDDLPKMENPRIVVRKKKRTLEVFDGEKLIRTYTIALGFEPVGDKETEGDGKTPEGDFYIFTKNPQSRFYLSLGVSYPGIDEAERGLDKKLISPDERDSIVEAVKQQKMPLQKTKLGGEIYIHGGGNAADWTGGCIALTNADMRELFNALDTKTPVRIEP